ncbi:hypothetical protein BOTBODRAFT_37958 [Botryobasidium botryosum FD-172 SS1]|uniref:Ricin B lectin domain-containing protein n=1 Tax=Botryobasidium botryosum (strain FD-172 SS1) TaxID=930990 RepID=A0A067LYR2_BOTB1|nr:hypothetical protein BOTBODRAFT_37958 [Botryobasidium botryosum FD-172 SS1]
MISSGLYTIQTLGGRLTLAGGTRYEEGVVAVDAQGDKTSILPHEKASQWLVELWGSPDEVVIRNLQTEEFLCRHSVESTSAAMSSEPYIWRIESSGSGQFFILPKESRSMNEVALTANPVSPPVTPPLPRTILLGKKADAGVGSGVVKLQLWVFTPIN